MSLFKSIRRFLKKVDGIREELSLIKQTLSKLQEGVARIEMRQLAGATDGRLDSHEFRAFSQWGEDGIIQFLIQHVKIKNNVFVEFGVQNYIESNTRFLLVNNNWSGLVIDGGKDNIDFIKQDQIYWHYNLKAVNAFIDRDNINAIISGNGIKGDIGLLSVDIDGNDYWVWQAIDVVSPAIVVAEYNHRFGKDASVTVPYDPSFVRENAHYSMIYYGASLRALVNLGNKKGFAFVGCNSAGNNAFFVRRDLLGDLAEISVDEGFVAGKFRESRDKEGKLLFLSPGNEAQLLASLPLVEVK